MTRIPETRPSDVIVAGWGECGRLLRISAVGTVAVMRRQKSMRYLFMIVMPLLAIEMVVLSVLTGSAMVAFVMIGLMIATFLGITTAHTVWRLIDPRRLVFLSHDRRAVLDVRFKRNGTIEPSNHGRLRNTTQAPGLREHVAAWLRTLDGFAFRIRAQNTKVAEIYSAQFPGLVAGTPDPLGRVPLTLMQAGDGHG
ncbi:hypothetical protein PTQ19_10485 [Microbacterium esteraromaticum]|uniref:hypothetical protein n=1 Tax=Microbacterium esteraromaticum TaxID=57043 RepID=UPI0023678E83|nr:hypothetical protein [Microbacterium esteraromaticum]WDH77949.1 hypothetical protein PTQ19_10485 [Microbacterium esteraromaticum]